MRWDEIKPLPKLVLLIAGVAVIVYGLKTAMSHGWIPAPGILQAVIPQSAKLPDVKDAVVSDVQPSAYPSSTTNDCGDPIRSEIWAWNAQMGALYANGGIDTTKGSLSEKHGACVHYTRQDDTTQMQTDLVTCAKDLVNSTECSGGQQFVTIMMDGAGQFLAVLNAQLVKLCKDCIAEIVGTTGFSRGEDKLMGPESWKRNPRNALGDGLVAGVLRDGDWNTAQKWLGDNQLKNNPDEHTYDPDAVNWVNASTYVDAAEKYVAGYCEDRKVVKNGHLTGETKNVCVKAIVTWTPGDVTAAKKKGGIVPIVSTKQYRAQMPSAVIGIRKWDKAHSDKIAAYLAAALEGGDQVKAFPEAKKRAAEISAKIYGEENGAYWLKYYEGSTEPDATGKEVELGGSYADNMNDALAVFGLLPGTNNNAKATYTIFAKIDMQQYADLFKSTPIPSYEQVATTSYLLQAKSLLDSGGSVADTKQYSADADPGQQFGDKNYQIEFPTGSAMLTSQAMEVVRQIKDDTAITGLAITLNGHTDNTGRPDANRTLSEARAASVEHALQQLAPTEFPEARFHVHGYGQDRPVADNSTTEGRAKNRRVEVILAE
jgi:outer membrane protein OmpA-like peptidoglycan-associated protein